jgi:hypothetical protein
MNRCSWKGLNMSTRWLGMLLGLPHLEVAGWSGFYSHHPKCSRWRSLLAMGAPDSPVRHRTVSGVPPHHPPVRAWSWSTVGGFVLMRHRTIRCPSDQLLWLLLRSLCCTVHGQSRPLRAGSRCSAGTLDSLVAHRIVRWIIAELRLRNPKLKSLRSILSGAPDSPVRQTREHFGFLYFFLFSPFFWLCIGLMWTFGTCRTFILEQTSYSNYLCLAIQPPKTFRKRFDPISLSISPLFGDWCQHKPKQIYKCKIELVCIK